MGALEGIAKEALALMAGDSDREFWYLDVALLQKRPFSSYNNSVCKR